MDDYLIVECPPTVEEYRRLRAAVGWGEPDVEAVERSLRNSLYWVCIVQQGVTIGCGRVIGDGGLHFYVQDIMVLPCYQRQGFGSRIMEKIMDYLRENACHGGSVGLMAARGAADFYLKYGFLQRPTMDYGPGMSLFWQ